MAAIVPVPTRLPSQIKGMDLADVFSAGPISDFARSLAFDDTALAFACKVNGTNCVRVYQWTQTESTGAWHAAAELVQDAMVHDFGASVSLCGNQQFLLCSDGFWELISEEQILLCLDEAEEPRLWLDNMVELVTRNSRGRSTDNITAVALWIY